MGRLSSYTLKQIDMKDNRYNKITTLVLLTLLMIAFMITHTSCSKKDKPQPQQPSVGSTTTTTTTHYYNSEYVRTNMIGSWNIYLEIHMGNDTTYEYYLPSMDVITFNQSTLTYNPPSIFISIHINYFIVVISCCYIIVVVCV